MKTPLPTVIQINNKPAPADRIALLMRLAADTDEKGNPVEPMISQEQLRALLDAPEEPIK